jgi:hypothetical protein
MVLSSNMISCMFTITETAFHREPELTFVS